MKDKVNPIGKKWEFDEEVTSVFTDMLSNSIPNYNEMRELCFRVGRNFIKDGDIVSDIGCSNGLASEKFILKFPNVEFILSDISKPMLSACREKYHDKANVNIVENDLREGLPLCFDNSLIISCLTIQFTPIEYRQKIFANIYNGLKVGGALILVEKVIGNSAIIDKIMVNEYYNIKRENGYTEELIQNKRKSLEGVLVPLTTQFNEQLLISVGFRQIDCFWRCLNFCAWVAIK